MHSGEVQVRELASVSASSVEFKLHGIHGFFLRRLKE